MSYTELDGAVFFNTNFTDVALEESGRLKKCAYLNNSIVVATEADGLLTFSITDDTAEMQNMADETIRNVAVYLAACILPVLDERVYMNILLKFQGTLFTADIFENMLVLKHNKAVVGKDNHYIFVGQAVEIFGSKNVRSCLIVGLESEEDTLNRAVFRY